MNNKGLLIAFLLLSFLGKAIAQPDSITGILLIEKDREIAKLKYEIEKLQIDLNQANLTIDDYKLVIAQLNTKITQLLGAVEGLRKENDDNRKYISELRSSFSIIENEALKKSLEVFGQINGIDFRLGRSKGQVHRAKKINSLKVKLNGASSDKRSVRIALFDSTNDKFISEQEIQLKDGFAECSFPLIKPLSKGNYSISVYINEKLIHEYPFQLN